MKKVLVVGLGYIGLPTAIVAANNSFDVVGFDIDEIKVTHINHGNAVIQEPEINEKLAHTRAYTSFYATARIEIADCFIIAVPTPFLADKKADLSYVWAATHTIGTVLKAGDVVILESTVGVGTTDELARRLAQQTGLVAGVDFSVAHCPERVLPGNIFHELVHNARIIGGINEQSAHAAAVFYKRFVIGQLYLTSSLSAEMVKLVENSSRDVAIAFANQVAHMAYAAGLNPFDIIALANKHPRVSILNPSCGVGGHCIAVDPWFLIETFPTHSTLLQTARAINDQKPHDIIRITKQCIKQWIAYHHKRPTILALGLTYKPNIDDLRESPALQIVQELALSPDIDLVACEPNISFDDIVRQSNARAVTLERGIADADIVLALVNHIQFNTITIEQLTYKKILDFCGIWCNQPITHTTETVQWPTVTPALASILEFTQGNQ
ncbi:MAG: nucleotide sugar dehydrogenase [Candidatus Babeliales bacterium]